MSRSKKAVFKNLLERDLLYIVMKAKVIDELKNTKILLKSTKVSPKWYTLYMF